MPAHSDATRVWSGGGQAARESPAAVAASGQQDHHAEATGSAPEAQRDARTGAVRETAW